MVGASIRIESGPRFTRILGLGAYRPERLVGNDEVAGPISSSDEWIRTRSGIRTRRWAGRDEGLLDMAEAAARVALQRSEIAAEGIDCVVVATISYFKQTPAAASELAHRIGATTAGAFDVSAACAGFCYALAMANDFVRGGSARSVLVVGAERMMDMIDPTDRGTAFLFADGAGAAVVGASAQPGIGPVVWGGDGARSDAIAQERSWTRWREELAEDPATPYPPMRMNGQAVFRWATTSVAEVGRHAVKAAGLTLDDLDAFIPHQANNRITTAIAGSLGLADRVVVARDLVDQGNTSGASIPLAMDTLLSSGQSASGDTALLLGFGAGLSYAGQVVALP
nr:beta-ketoacyl-ACP synthase III [Haloechinothrix aidingensis]